MQEAAILHLPNHASVPSTNVFAGQDGFCKSAERASIIVENFLLTGILTRGLHFKPKAGDVILVSGPGSGQDMVGRVLACIMSDSPADLLHHHETVSKEWTLPWIESRYFDQADELLQDGANFFSSQHRVLRTQMALSLFNPAHHQQQRDVKYVCLVRNPLDLRAAVFKYIRDCYLVADEQGVEPDFDFDEFFPMADAFVQVPVSLCEVGMQRADAYEQFILDWLTAQRKLGESKIHIVFYEALVSRPQHEVRRLCAFLGREFVPQAVRLVETDHLEGLGASLFALPSSIRQIYTFWENRFSAATLMASKQLRTYETLFEHETKQQPYPYPQRVLPKESDQTTQQQQQQPQPTLASLAKPFMKNMTKLINEQATRVSVRMGGKLPLSPRPAPASPAPTPASPASPSANSAKAAEEEEDAMQVMLLRMSLRQQGVSEDIVKTVAVRADALSEML